MMITLENWKDENPFFLAPMAGVTDKPFRSFMREMSCGIMTSELVSARGLTDGGAKSLHLMEFSPDQRPFGIQIFGEDPYILSEGAKRVEAFGADFIDLNLGCPVNKIVRKGAGSALLKDLKTLSKILKALRLGVKIPLSLKVRTGWDEDSRNADQIAHIAFNEGFSWMSIHGRTRKAAYSGKADWHYIKQVRVNSPIPVVGNGDLISGQGAMNALMESACQGVMIGRGSLNDPWIFASALSLFKQHKKRLLDKTQPLPDSESEGLLESQALSCSALSSSRAEKPLGKNNRRSEFKNRERPGTKERGGLWHLRANQNLEKGSSYEAPPSGDFKQALDKLKVHLENFHTERMFLLQLKKFSAWFSSGFPGSAEFRRSLFAEKDKQALMQRIDEFFISTRGFKKPEPVYEPFLKRGHG